MEICQETLLASFGKPKKSSYSSQNISQLYKKVNISEIFYSSSGKQKAAGALQMLQVSPSQILKGEKYMCVYVFIDIVCIYIYAHYIYVHDIYTCVYIVYIYVS